MPARPLSRSLALAATLLLSLPGAAAAAAECIEVPVANDRCPGWVSTHDVADPQGNSGRDEAVAATAAGGRVFVAGGTEVGAPGMDVLALAQQTGEKLWTARVDGAQTALLYRHSLTMSPDGARLFLMASTADNDFLVVAFDPASGETLWRTEYDRGGWDRARDLAVSPDSSEVYVTGTSEARAGDLALVALSASGGAVRWVVRYLGPKTSFGADAGYSVEVAPDGSRVFVAGRSTGNSSWDLVTLAYDVPREGEAPSATWAWVRRFVPAVNVGLASRVGLALSEDGSRVVTSGEGDNNFWTIAYDGAGGQELWSGELEGTPLSEGWFSTLDESKVRISEGRVIVAISKAWDPGPLLASYDLATGAELWTTRYVSGPPLETASMVLAPDGDTIYTLASTTDAGYGASVAAFDADTGAQQWVGRMNSATEHIYGNSLAISPSGDALFATGGISEPEADGQDVTWTGDYLTWSYSV